MLPGAHLQASTIKILADSVSRSGIDPGLLKRAKQPTRSEKMAGRCIQCTSGAECGKQGGGIVIFQAVKLVCGKVKQVPGCNQLLCSTGLAASRLAAKIAERQQWQRPSAGLSRRG